tara:strand:- start:767 stop:1123 length:357 start_codon:yes stop_codon:yes gene_type:complete
MVRKRIIPEVGQSYLNTYIFLVDEEGKSYDFHLLHCDVKVEKLDSSTSSFDYGQGIRDAKRDAETLASLTPEEEETHIKWARDNHKPGEPIDKYIHPVAKREAEIMNREIQNELREEV